MDEQLMTDQLERELEKIKGQLSPTEQIARILSTITLDPYSILSIHHSATSDEVKKRYRALSRQIHPDKTKIPDASRAFDLLKKAEAVLMDTERRAKLDEVYTEAELQAQQQGGEVEEVYKELLIKDEFQRRMALKREMERQGQLEKLKDEQDVLKAQKNADGEKWEDERDQRVNSWRKYSGKVEKKKKRKQKVLA